MRTGSTDTIKVPKTVLLADNSTTIQRVVELAFAREDVTVVSVRDGNQAIDAITQSTPDLVLADIGMPGPTGYDVVEFIRSRSSLSNLPVLLLASAFDPVDQTRANRVGADGVLTKPFDPAVLVGRVRELLTTGRGAAPQVLPPASLPAPWGAPSAGAVAPTGAPFVGEASPEATFEPDLPLQEPASEGTAPGADAYFAQVDQAFATLQRTPRPLVPEVHAVQEEWSPDDEVPALSVPAAPVQRLPLTDVFAALLDVERTGVSDGLARFAVAAPPSPSAIDMDALAHQVARLVLDQLSDRVVRESVAQIVSQTAERLVREEIDRIKRNIP